MRTWLTTLTALLNEARDLWARYPALRAEHRRHRT